MAEFGEDEELIGFVTDVAIQTFQLVDPPNGTSSSDFRAYVEASADPAALDQLRQRGLYDEAFKRISDGVHKQIHVALSDEMLDALPTRVGRSAERQSRGRSRATGNLTINNNHDDDDDSESEESDEDYVGRDDQSSDSSDDEQSGHDVYDEDATSEDERVILGCGHEVVKESFRHWVRNKATCPRCDTCVICSDHFAVQLEWKPLDFQ